MSKTARSVLTIGIYALAALISGLKSLAIPSAALGVVGLAETSAPWIRAVGCLLIGVGAFYYLYAARSLENQMDPQLMIDALMRIADEDASKSCNVVPEEVGIWVRAMQATA